MFFLSPDPGKPSSKIVFIADDDQDDLELIREALMEIDTTIKTSSFSDGLEVLGKLIECEDVDLPDYLILDYSMPGLTGSQVLKEMVAQPRNAHIVKFVLSTSSTVRDKEECLKSGAAAYFVKPDSMNGLRTVAKKMLHSRLFKCTRKGMQSPYLSF